MWYNVSGALSRAGLMPACRRSLTAHRRGSQSPGGSPATLYPGQRQRHRVGFYRSLGLPHTGGKGPTGKWQRRPFSIHSGHVRFKVPKRRAVGNGKWSLDIGAWSSVWAQNESSTPEIHMLRSVFKATGLARMIYRVSVVRLKRRGSILLWTTKIGKKRTPRTTLRRRLWGRREKGGNLCTRISSLKPTPHPPNTQGISN